MKKLIVLLVCVTLLLTACAAQSPASENVSSSAMDAGGYSEQAMSAPEASAEKAETGEGSTDAFADTPVNANRKMTYSASFSITQRHTIRIMTRSKQSLRQWVVISKTRTVPLSRPMAAGFMDAALTSHYACRLISLTVSWSACPKLAR